MTGVSDVTTVEPASIEEAAATLTGGSRVSIDRATLGPAGAW